MDFKKMRTFSWKIVALQVALIVALSYKSLKPNQTREGSIRIVAGQEGAMAKVYKKTLGGNVHYLDRGSDFTNVDVCLYLTNCTL